MFPNFGMK